MNEQSTLELAGNEATCVPWHQNESEHMKSLRTMCVCVGGGGGGRLVGVRLSHESTEDIYTVS